MVIAFRCPIKQHTNPRDINHVPVLFTLILANLVFHQFLIPDFMLLEISQGNEADGFSLFWFCLLIEYNILRLQSTQVDIKNIYIKYVLGISLTSHFVRLLQFSQMFKPNLKCQH